MNLDNSFKRSILIPLGGVLALLLLLAVYAVDRMNRLHVAEEMQHIQRTADTLFGKKLESEAASLGALLEALARDPRLIDGLRRRDRAALLRDTADLYGRLREGHGITHFYFTGPDRVNLLRVHDPERHGDVIDRVTTRQAERDGREAWGIELGPLGLFTLRVVRPVFAQGQLLGYLELGEEIGHVIRAIAAAANVDIHVLIYKRFLDRGQWRAGNALMGRAGEWDRFPDVVLTESTGPLPADLIASHRAFHDHDYGRPATLMSWEQARRPLFQPLRDAAGREVGEMVLGIDVGEMARQSRQLVLMVVGVSLPVGLALLVLFHFQLRRIQQRSQAAALEREAETARHRRAMQAQDAQFRLLLDSTAEAIYGVDPEGRCIFVNPAFLAMLGYGSAEELLGRDIHALIHHHHADGRPYPVVQCPIHEAFAQDRPTHADDEVFWHKDGHAIPVEYWAHPIRRDGQVVGAVAAFLDISARKRAEAVLQASEARLKEAQRLAQLGDWELDLVNDHLIWSEEVYRIFEIDADHFSATLEAFLSAIHAEDRAEVEQAFAASVAERRPYDIVHRLRMSDGRIKHVHERGETRYDEQGRPLRCIGTVQDITASKQSEAQLVRLAHYDALTGLPNRVLLQSRLQRALDRSRRHGARGALLFLDLDHFKNVNDSLGHTAGDELLVEIGRRIAGRIREEDTLARLGGDEFVVLLEWLERAEDAAVLARDLIERLNQPFTLADGHTLYIGASIGISLFPDDSQEGDALMRNADAALFQSKAAGRNTYHFYTESLTLAAKERLDMELGLRRALEAGEFLLHYQPQVAAPDGLPLGVEALVRWQPPGQALIPPARFIPIAEETGLIVPLGEWVLRSACAQARAWLDAGLPAMTVAVNLSPRQFRDPDLVAKVRRILAETRLPPARLELEITESAVMDQGDRALALLRELKDLGLSLSIDDFGTGYYSLAYLKRFAIDKLKIDQSFVRDIPDDQDSMEITASIIAMAKNLRLKVLAEGVETEDQLAFLQIHNCDACQGYLFSRPLPAPELERWLSVQAAP
jgi:diguanylate cyclase (GGDEF)-like protein/PAS domain S-box-containing protein